MSEYEKYNKLIRESYGYSFLKLFAVLNGYEKSQYVFDDCDVIVQVKFRDKKIKSFISFSKKYDDFHSSITVIDDEITDFTNGEYLLEELLNSLSRLNTSSDYLSKRALSNPDRMSMVELVEVLEYYLDSIFLSDTLKSELLDVLTRKNKLPNTSFLDDEIKNMNLSYKGSFPLFEVNLKFKSYDINFKLEVLDNSLKISLLRSIICSDTHFELVRFLFYWNMLKNIYPGIVNEVQINIYRSVI